MKYDEKTETIFIGEIVLSPGEYDLNKLTQKILKKPLPAKYEWVEDGHTGFVWDKNQWKTDLEEK